MLESFLKSQQLCACIRSISKQVGSQLCDPTPISSPVGGLLNTINKSNLVFISYGLLERDGDGDKAEAEKFSGKARVLVITQRFMLHSFSTIYQHQKSPAKLGLNRIVSSTNLCEIGHFFDYTYEIIRFKENTFIEMYKLCVAHVLLLLITWGLCICLTSTRNLIISTLWQNLQHTHSDTKRFFLVFQRNFQPLSLCPQLMLSYFSQNILIFAIDNKRPPELNLDS